MTKSGESDHSLCKDGSVSGSGVRTAYTCAATRDNTEAEAPGESFLLLEHTYCVGDGLVTCRLYRTASDSASRPEGYEVRMEGFYTRAFAMLGCDRSAARVLYDTLVRNTVTPCALQDVMEDFWEVHPPVGLWE